MSRDPHPPAALAHRTFEDIADTQFATDLLHVHRLAFVSEAAVTGDDEKPADARERGDDLLALPSKTAAFRGSFEVVPT